MAAEREEEIKALHETLETEIELRARREIDIDRLKKQVEMLETSQELPNPRRQPQDESNSSI